jgi:hypothetical protein
MKMLPRRRSVVPAYRIQGHHIVVPALDAPKVVEPLRPIPLGMSIYISLIAKSCDEKRNM